MYVITYTIHRPGKSPLFAMLQNRQGEVGRWIYPHDPSYTTTSAEALDMSAHDRLIAGIADSDARRSTIPTLTLEQRNEWLAWNHPTSLNYAQEQQDASLASACL